METKHTNGKWEIKYPNNSHLYIVSEYGEVCRVSAPMQTDEAEANAKLISAAPELLEALIRVQKNVRFSSNENLMTQVNNAIKKATE